MTPLASLVFVTGIPAAQVHDVMVYVRAQVDHFITMLGATPDVAAQEMTAFRITLPVRIDPETRTETTLSLDEALADLRDRV